MVIEVFVAHIDVLNMKTELGKTRQFQASSIVSKDLAINMWFYAKNLKLVPFDFLDELYNSDDVKRDSTRCGTAFGIIEESTT